MGLLAENRSFFHKMDYLPVHLGLGAGALSYAYARLLGLEFEPLVSLAAAAAMFGIYAVNNWFDLEEDLVNKDHVTRGMARTSVYGGVASIAVAFLVSAMLEPLMVFPVAFLLASVLLYSAKFLPSSFPYRRVKEVPFLKNLFVGAVWTLFCLWMPLTYTGKFYAVGFLPILALNGVHYTVTTVIPDVRDMEGDRKAGVVTIPTLWGVSGAMAFNLVITAAGTGAYLSGVFSGRLPSEALLPGATSLTAVLPILAADRQRSVEMTQVHELNFLFGFPLLLLLAEVVI